MKRWLMVGMGLVLLLGLSVGVASADLGDRPLSLRARGDDVVELQRGLAALGLGVPASGYYGPLTRHAVAAFQARAGLPVTGQADAATIAELKGWLEELAAPLGGQYEGEGLSPYGERYAPYANPWAPYGGAARPFGPGAYGWGTPMGPGMMGGGMMGGMMGGGWGSGMMGGAWGSSPFGW